LSIRGFKLVLLTVLQLAFPLRADSHLKKTRTNAQIIAPNAGKGQSGAPMTLARGTPEGAKDEQAQVLSGENPRLR
jgi:hypothetical protein